MEPLTILIAVAGIVATGALSKVGENVTDNVLSKSKELLTCIKNKSPRIAVVIENAEQHPIDYSQAPHRPRVQTVYRMKRDLIVPSVVLL